MKSRRLALLVAIALGGGGFLSSAQSVSAADVTGNNVTIDDTQAPSNNAKHPGGGAAFGTAAGFIKEEANSGNVTGNTLTFKNINYTKQLYGGLTFGTGNVTYNRVIVNPATGTFFSNTDGIFGGAANGGGNVEYNHAEFNGDHLNGDLVGGMTKGTGTGIVKYNTALLKSGNANAVYGGIAAAGTNGDVLHNQATIENGHTGIVYGGYADENGNVKDNIVTVKGGIMTGVEGGHSDGTGEVSGNTVNLGDGTSDMAAGYAINGTIYGGRNDSHPDKVSNNTLNVNANAVAHNIKNFETINFNFNAHMNTSNPLLTLTDSSKTKIKSFDQLHVKNAKVGDGTLIENTNGVEVDNPAAVGRTADKTETIIRKHTNGDKIIYRTYQFKDATEKDTDGTAAWGGRSVIGNTTTKNKITLTGHHGGQNVYGGWTSGTGSTATGENAKNHSIDNTITFNGALATDTVGNMFGGLTVSPGGNATGNRAVLEKGKVTGSLTGGSVGTAGGDATGNFVDINGGNVIGATYGGSVGGTGKAEKNIVTVTGGTVKGDIYGGKSTSGNATGNEVTIKGGSATNSDVYGGESASGDATGNRVEISGGTAQDVYGGKASHGNATGNTVTIKGNGGTVQNITGGRSNSGNATGNTVNLGDGTADFTTGITGTISGGSGTTYGNDYMTGNTLNVHDNVQATNISNFSEINFRFNQFVTKTDSFLKLTDAETTTIRSLSDLHLHGEHGHKGTLIEKSGASGTIDITDGKDRLGKTENTKELVLAKSSDNKKITYESYIFKGATTSTTDDGGTYKDIFGGRSILGNTTTQNTITVSDAVTYRNAYGGWTSGTGTTLTEKGNSISNKITVGSTVTDVTGTVYGGFTDVPGGNATSNEVTIEKSITGGVVGGKAAGDASGNTVNVTNATVKSVTGGDGVTTNNNTVNLNGATVNGAVKGGTAANGTGNTLNVKGENSAQSVEGFQKMKFHADTAASGQAMLNLTTGATTLDKNAIDADGSTTNSRVTLLRNDNGINLTGYTNGVLKSTIEGNTEKNIDVEKNAAGDKIVKVTYEGAQFADVQNAVEKDLGSGKKNAYGGISRANNATRNNKITVNETYENVYGGYTSGTSSTAEGEKKNSHDNTVTITGGTVTGKVYGGYTEAADGKTYNNTVNLNGGNLSNAEISGGNKTATGNTLNVNTAATVKKIDNFQTVTFKDKDANLTLTGTGVKFDLASVNAGFDAAAQKQTLVESSNALDLTGDTFRSDLSADGTKETNIEASTDKKKIVRYGYTLKNATTATTVGFDTWGGRSAAGNTTTGNALTLTAGAHTNVYGGWTSVTGSNAPADQQKNSTLNKIKVSGAANVTGKVYGGFTDVAGGKAMGNTVAVEKNLNADLIGGKSASGEASGNTVTVGNVTVNSITGGDGATTNDNIVNLSGTTVTGTLTGGTAANGTRNTLNVKGKDNKAGTIANIQKMNFDATGLAKNDTMLEVTGTAQTDVNWAELSATGTAVKPLTLLKNANGINLTGYTGAVKSKTTETTETNVDVRKTGNKITEITYEGYQFKGVTTATADGGNLYGGISKAGNSTRENTITVNSGSHTNVYGGHTSGSGTGEADKNNSYNNTVTIAGGTVTGKLYGGYTDAADGKTYNNTVNLNGGNLSNAEISGGNSTIGTEKGNTLNVNTAATVKKIDNFQMVTFKDKDAKLTLTGTGVKFDLATVKAGFDAAAQEQTLVESSNALDLANGKTFRSDLSADGTKETNIEVSADKKKITRYGYTFKNATTATTDGSDTWGGRSAAGRDVENNAFTLNEDTHTNVYGGWTSGTGSKAAADQRGDSTKNSVTVKGTATVSGTVYGGYTDVMGGKATGNTVTVEKTLNADLIGGKAVAEASGNTVNLANATVKSITGGSGTVTNDNRINLRDAKVTGMVTGGTAANATGNTLNVSYGTKTTEIGDYSGIQNLHFDMEKAPLDGTAHTMLRLTNVGGAKSLSHTHIDLHRDGAAPKLQRGDKITLMENAGGDINVGENLTAKGTDGVTRNYEFALATVGKTLIATVTKAGMGEQSKSIVETRAGASAFLNDGGDYLVGSGMEAAKKEARAAAQAGNGAYGLWAGMGGGALRHKTGSYVDMKGWNLGVGWARENAVQAGSLTFGPFIEYGRGSYDSYLDDGTHGSGKTSFFGAGMMARFETGDNWVDGSLRIGRTKSDYTGLATYDTTSTYYGVQVGVGKDYHVSETDAVSAYVRYSYTHTAGTSAHLSKGETYDFDAVNSHRLRIGARYTHGGTALSQIYAGLAWEYEFDGDARATYQDDSTPSPSLKGGSALLELGYRFAPKADSRVSYDLNLTGWQGKRQGITGGLSVKWAF